MTQGNQTYPQGQAMEVYPQRAKTDGPWCIAEVAVVEKQATRRNETQEMAVLRCSRMYGHVGRHRLELDGDRLSATIEWVDTWDPDNKSGGRVT